MANKVKVVFPGGRVAWLDYKIAHTRTIVRMGGRVVETEPAPVVPKAYATPITQAIVDPVADTEEEFEQTGYSEPDFSAPAPAEVEPEPKAVKAAPKKDAPKKMGRPKKETTKA